MSESLFTSLDKASSSLFPSTSEGTSRSSLFSSNIPAPARGGLFSRLGSPVVDSSKLFSRPETLGPPESPPRRRQIRIPAAPPPLPRDTPATPSRRRTSASSQISRKYLRIQQSHSGKVRRTSEDVVEAEATSDLSLTRLADHVNSRERLSALLARFGPLVRTFCNRKKGTAIIHFASAEHATRAKAAIPLEPEFTGVSVFFHKRRQTSVKRPVEVAQPPSDSARAKVARLGGLQGQVARSSAERLELLKQRDELVRQSLAGSDLSKLPGLCPDMCPERERYARQEQHRLAIFEVLPGSHPSQVEHARAVKEYARSSADQPPPLPLEMRPLPVLTRTMNYLLAEVADRCREADPAERISWGEWYDYLWNRTRAIRKEITQQRFCSIETADIVEQTARFHIFAAVWLCGLPVDEFDPKINDENLTKCLQTLKELYQDLPADKGSPNEAEFRSYMILRNLNDTAILNEVTQLAPHIRTSLPVRLAMAAYFAMSDNHYVQFFKLARRATFLQAALLHRYFTQVRSRALQIMVTAYTPPGKAGNRSVFPLASLTDQLGFEDEDEALEFCVAYGLRHQNAMVVFTRSPLRRAVELLPARSKVLIEAKMGQRRIGEILNGGPVQVPFPLMTPKSSFDAENRFIGTWSCSLPQAEKKEDGELEEEGEAFEEEEEVIEGGEKEEAQEDQEEMDSSQDIYDEEELEEGEIVEERPVQRRSLVSIVSKAPEPRSSPVEVASLFTEQCTSASPVRVVSRSSGHHSSSVDFGPKSLEAQPERISPMPFVVSSLGIQDVVEELLENVVDANLVSVAESEVRAAEQIEALACQVQEELLKAVIRQMVTHEADAAVQEEAKIIESAAVEVRDDLVAAWLHSELTSISQASLFEVRQEQNLALSVQTDTCEELVTELAREAVLEDVADSWCSRVLVAKFFLRWRMACRRRVVRRDAALHMPAGPPLEHSRLIAARLFACNPSLPPRPALPAGRCDPDRLGRVLERKQHRLFLPFPPAAFGPGPHERLLLLLGQPGVSMDVAEWVLAKLDHLDFIDPVLLGRPLPASKAPVSGVVCLGCLPPAHLQSLPLLIIKDRMEQTSEVERALPKAQHLLLSCLEPVRNSWSEALLSELQSLLALCAPDQAQPEPSLPLPALLERFLHTAVFQPLSAFAEQLRLERRLVPDVNSLINFYASGLAVLEDNSPPELSYRFLHLLKIERFPGPHRGDWEDGCSSVQRFLTSQHFSPKCRTECFDAIEQARLDCKYLARELDVQRWLEPPATALPWVRLVLLWAEDRLAEVSRQCASALAGCRAKRTVLQCCLDAAATRCRLPAVAQALTWESAAAPALARAREHQWVDLCASFGLEERGMEKPTARKSREGAWTEMEEEMQQLRAAMQDQLRDSLNISQLYEAQ